MLAALVSLNSNVSQTDQAEGKHSVLAASARDLPIGPGMTRTFLTEAKLPQGFRTIADEPACKSYRCLGKSFFTD